MLQETASAVEFIIAEFKGPAGLDFDGIHLFKSTEAVDSHWATASKYLGCMQVGSFVRSVLIICHCVKTIYTNVAILCARLIVNLAMCCVLQDPPGIQLYVAVKMVELNGVQLQKYRCRHGSNSLEGLHVHL